MFCSWVDKKFSIIQLIPSNLKYTPSFRCPIAFLVRQRRSTKLQTAVIWATLRRSFSLSLSLYAWHYYHMVVRCARWQSIEHFKTHICMFLNLNLSILHSPPPFRTHINTHSPWFFTPNSTEFRLISIWCCVVSFGNTRQRLCTWLSCLKNYRLPKFKHLFP